MKNKYIILGNGFSIDLMKRLKQEDAVDLKNLFKKGDEVVWPNTKEHGFLSYKHCSNLWTLGARTYMSDNECNDFITDIITSLNVFSLASQKPDNKAIRDDNSNIFIAAHNELSTYLRSLFIYYNEEISDNCLNAIVDNVPLINYIQKAKNQGSNVTIVTYNYDIYLERLLKLKRIPFNIEGLQKRNCKVKIIKPHGSISFASKKQPIDKPFEIKSTLNSIGINISDLKLDYNLRPDNSLVNVIIPPAGDSNRSMTGWVQDIRQVLTKAIEDADEQDELIILGISYCHVDRMEIDKIITKINSNMTVKYIDPYPSTTFNAVLSSIFKNYIHMKSSEYIMEE